jgi:hypothetical protein
LGLCQTDSGLMKNTVQFKNVTQPPIIGSEVFYTHTQVRVHARKIKRTTLIDVIKSSTHSVAVKATSFILIIIHSEMIS